MKKNLLLISFSFLILLLGNPLTIFAKENDDGNQPEQKRENRREIRNDKKELREQKKASISALREERKASMSAIKEEFKLNIQKIKDNRKQQIVEKFVEKMNRVNQRRVEHWNKILARLGEILSFIGSKLGSNNSAVQIATQKLSLAKSAVDAQGQKEYTMNIGTESALKNNAGQAMSQELSDLKNVLKLVNEARKAVHDALRFLRQGTPTASPSAIPTI